MSIKVEVPPFLRHLTGGETVFYTDRDTVSGCLDEFVREFPTTRDLLFDEDGSLKGYVNIFVNGATTYPEGLSKKLKDDDEIAVVYMVDGG
jgi:molybdopterin converting factor small subunit